MRQIHPRATNQTAGARLTLDAGSEAAWALACLAADGKLAEGAPWVQESIIGSTFTGRYRWLDRDSGKVAPVITGRAFVNGEANLLLDERDPFCWGIR